MRAIRKMYGSLKLVVWYQPEVRLVYFLSSLHHEAITQAGVMALIEFHNEISVQSLLRVSKLVILLDLHRKENSDTPTIVIID
jgi:hypothetical protein